MSFFHLRASAGAAWPPVPAPEVSQVWAAYQALDRTQWLSPGELEALQLRQLRALLAHCFQHVAYYRRLLQGAGLGDRPIDSLDDFRRLPLLTRAAYQANFADLQARALPDGVVAAGGGYSSGTNGVPIQVRKTNRDGLWWNALFLRDLEWGGLDPRGRLAAIRLVALSRDELPRALAGLSFPYWTQSCGLLLESGPAFVMDVRQDPRRQLAWLHEVRPDYLVSLPSNLEHLASLLRDCGDRLPGLRAIQAVGEALSEAARERIEDGFGAPVKNLYSTTEAGYLASPCPLGHGLHVHSENVLAEVLNAEDQPCRPGETGRLVLTTLQNFLAPFVRYDILDEVTLAPGPCPCGRGLPLWSRVDGRRHPLLHLPNGGRKSSLGITLGVRQVGGCRQFQIVQRTVDHVVLRIVPDATWQAGHADRLRQAVWEEFGAPVRVDVEMNDALERPAGGKWKLIDIRIAEGAAAA